MFSRVSTFIFRQGWLFTGVFAVAILSVLTSGDPAFAQKGNGGGGGGTPPASPAIAFASGSYVYVMNSDGSNVRLLVASNTSLVEPSWSPDGSQVAFVGNPAGGSGLGVYVINVDGAGLRKVTPKATPDSPVAWSPVPAPDGEYKLAFVDGIPYPEAAIDGMTDVFVVNLDGTERTRLTYTTAESDPWENRLSWSRDGTRLALDYLADSGCDLLQLAPDGIGGVEVLFKSSITDVPGSPLQSMYTSSPDWARLSDRIALTAMNYASGNQDVWIVDLSDPANPVNVTGSLNVHHQKLASWSPDDLNLVFRQDGRKASGLYSVGVDGRGLRLLSSSSGSLPDWKRVP